MTLDTADFRFCDRPARHTSFANDEEITKSITVRANNFSKVSGASKVTIFDHSQLVSGFLLERYLTLPCRQLCDASVPDRLIMTQQADNLCPRHMSTKPLLLPLLDSTTTHRNFRSTAPKLTDRRSRAGVARMTFSLSEPFFPIKREYNPKHKWKCLRGTTSDEFVLIKI
jgi:hypothetical protein